MIVFYGAGLYDDPDLGWKGLAAGIETVAVPASTTGNRTMMAEPYVADVSSACWSSFRLHLLHVELDGRLACAEANIPDAADRLHHRRCAWHRSRDRSRLRRARRYNLLLADICAPIPECPYPLATPRTTRGDGDALPDAGSQWSPPSSTCEDPSRSKPPSARAATSSARSTCW